MAIGSKNCHHEMRPSLRVFASTGLLWRPSPSAYSLWLCGYPAAACWLACYRSFPARPLTAVGTRYTFDPVHIVCKRATDSSDEGHRSPLLGQMSLLVDSTRSLIRCLSCCGRARLGELTAEEVELRACGHHAIDRELPGVRCTAAPASL